MCLRILFYFRLLMLSMIKVKNFINIIKQNWNQFLLVVKATALKQQISKFCLQIQRTDASIHIDVSHWPVITV